MSGSDFLKKQLEVTRFEHALNYVEQSAGGKKKLTGSELAHLNQMLNHTSEPPWRSQQTMVTLPSGQKKHFNVILNVQLRSRDILGNAHDILHSGEIAKAASYLYSHLVSEHFFNDGNRRTAVIATYWLLLEAGKKIDAHELHRLGLGDLNKPEDLEALEKNMEEIINRA
ncbi:MAG: Fic family protein [Pseudomonadota bacterium]|nr:Fic family protein [Pseudomonadota bacterium]